MANKNKTGRVESALGAPRQADLATFELTKEYRHLAGAPVAEFETCDTSGIAKVNLNGPINSKSKVQTRHRRQKRRRPE